MIVDLRMRDEALIPGHTDQGAYRSLLFVGASLPVWLQCIRNGRLALFRCSDADIQRVRAQIFSVFFST
ncbi:hypothetical protein PQR08_27930 [Caballeronia jiangsuensis]|uniref:Uncharacterized protein n=1 Tax=Caballeronia jiangsuensis TaxID=1458357 RepID=A0ABW9CRS8_9BURK